MSNKTLILGKPQGYLLQVRHMPYELISVDDRFEASCSELTLLEIAKWRKVRF